MRNVIRRSHGLSQADLIRQLNPVHLSSQDWLGTFKEPGFVTIEASMRLEPDDGELSHPVLSGGSDSDVTPLPDSSNPSLNKQKRRGLASAPTPITPEDPLPTPEAEEIN